MFHQVFICDETQDPDSSRNLLLDQNNVNNAPQTIKQENLTSGDNTVGLVLAEDIKMAVGTLKSEKCSLLNNQTVMETDTEVTKMDLDAKDFLVPSLSSMVFPVSQTGQTFMLPVTTGPAIQPLQSTLISSPGQVILEQPQQAPGIQPLGPTYVFQTSVENALQPQPTLIKMSGNIIQLAAPPAPLLTGALAVSSSPVINTDFLQQSTQDIQNLPTVSQHFQKTEPLSSLINVVGEGLKREKTDLTSNQTTIKKKEQPMEDDLHAGLSDSGDNDVHNGADKFQECNGNINSNLHNKVKGPGTESNEAISFSNTDSAFEVQHKQSNPKSQKHCERKFTNDDKLRSMYNIKECSVVINNSISKFTTSYTIQNSNVKNKVGLILKEGGVSKEYEDNSCSDREEEHTDVDNSSDSDWETEYLDELLKNKIQKKFKKGVNKKMANVTQNINHTKNLKQIANVPYSKSSQCQINVTNNVSKILSANNTNNKIKLNSVIENKSLQKKLFISSVSNTRRNTSGPSSSTAPHFDRNVTTARNHLTALNRSKSQGTHPHIHSSIQSNTNKYSFQSNLQSVTSKKNINFHLILEKKEASIFDSNINCSKKLKIQTVAFNKCQSGDVCKKSIKNNSSIIQIESKCKDSTQSSNDAQNNTGHGKGTILRNLLRKPRVAQSSPLDTTPDAAGISSDTLDDRGDGDDNLSCSEDDSTLFQGTCHYCKKCDKYFEILDRYLYHKKYSLCYGHRREARHQCKICGKCFQSRETRESHENSHTNARPFKCSDCDKCFNSKSARGMHYKNMHLNKKTIYLCCFCGYITKSSGHLLAHEESHRLPEGSEIPKPFKCLVCGKGFISKWKVQRHQREHQLRKCPECSEKFKTRGQLTNHLGEVHKIIKTYECKECAKQFKQPGGLRSHLKFNHSSVLSFTCDICDKGFKRKNNLQQHMITHSDERPISCPECGDSFKRITHLKQHTAAFHGEGRK